MPVGDIREFIDILVDQKNGKPGLFQLFEPTPDFLPNQWR
jgi:hypothetical protein